METRRPALGHFLRKMWAFISTANQVWNKLSVLLRSSCSSLTNSEGPEMSGNLRRDGTHPREHLIYPPDSWIVLSKPPCSVSSTSWQSPLGRAPFPWRLMLSGSVSWFLAYLFLLWLSHCKFSLMWPDVWLEIWDWTKEEKVGKTHGTVHIPTATNSQECLDRDKAQAGRSSGSQDQPLRGRACVTCWRKQLPGARWSW